MTTTLGAERVELLGDLRRQLERLDSARARTAKAIRQIEYEMAPGKAREREVVNSK